MSFFSKIIVFGLLTVVSEVSSRKWRDTGTGTVILEEAWTIPELLNATSPLPPLGGSTAELFSDLLDIHNQRLAFMDNNGVDFMVLSCAQPCVQGISDPVVAANMATKVNNELAAAIKNNTERFGAFTTVAMHDPNQAAAEVRRTVKKFGFLGVLVNDYQQSGPDNATLLFYDRPQYDAFWKTVTDLDVPVYFHPRSSISQVIDLSFAHSPFIQGPPQEFAVTLSNHVLGLAANGVFDRFPTLKVIVGHLGERLPSDLFRVDEQLRRQISQGMPMQKNASDYWRTNLFETTSGNFATDLLEFHIKQIGLDRIMFSVDYPYVPIPEGATWVNGLAGTLNKKDLASLKRDVAIKLLKLND